MRHMDRFGSVAAGKEAKLSAARSGLGVWGQARLVAAYRVRLLPQQVNQGTITEGSREPVRHGECKKPN